MAYVKQIWQDRVVEKPMTFNQQLNTDGTLTLTPSPGLVTSEGTKITAERMNHIEDGIQQVSNINFSKFAIIEGSIELNPNPDESAKTTVQTLKEINFPSGFNKNNCIAIAFGFKQAEAHGYCYGMSDAVSAASFNGGFVRNVILGTPTDDAKIRIEVWSWSTAGRTSYYKIVLMRTDI